MSLSYRSPINMSRQELYEQIWAIPTTHLAREFGISDVGLAKICMKHNIPKPPMGYWERIRAGQNPERPPLPAVQEQWLEKVTIHTDLGSLEHVPVPDTLEDPHPLVAMTKKAFRNAHTWNGIMRPPATSKHLHIASSKESLDRALRIMDALVKALEKRGFKVTPSCEPDFKTEVVVKGEKLAFALRETTRRTDRVLTKEEEQKKARQMLYWVERYDYQPSGVLVLEILDVLRVRRQWKDGKIQRLENMLSSFIEGLVAAAENSKQERKELEIRLQEQKERRLKKEETELRKIDEEDKIKKLRKLINAWEESKKVRAFVRDVRKTFQDNGESIAPGSNLGKWLEWAEWYAERIDPLVKG
jgi:hypothetical protein